MKKKGMIEIVLVILGAIITVGISIKSIVDKNRSEAELKQRDKELLQKQDAIVNSQSELIGIQKEYEQSLKDIIGLQSQLQQKQIRLLR